MGAARKVLDADLLIDHVARYGDALVASAASAGIDAAVPSCPEWRVRDLVNHTSMVHGWASKIVSGEIGLREGEREPTADYVAPTDEHIFDAFGQSHARLVASLRAAPDGLECWTFLPAPSPRTFWARRQAHETAVHAADAALAAGEPPRVEASLAEDGIDELLFGFFARRRARDATEFVMSLRATDTGSMRAVRVRSDGVSSSEDRADVEVSASASDLYLFLWNRVLDAAVLGVEGDEELLANWRHDLRVTWS
jgi:uncharacterized protein (TIGR03083 family)